MTYTKEQYIGIGEQFGSRNAYDQIQLFLDLATAGVPAPTP